MSEENKTPERPSSWHGGVNLLPIKLVMNGEKILKPRELIGGMPMK